MNSTEPGNSDPGDANPTHPQGEPDAAEVGSQASLGKAAWAIYNELAKIRMLLQARHQADQSVQDVTYYHCAMCEETIPGEQKAERHAVQDHGAPREDWREVFREVNEE